MAKADVNDIVTDELSTGIGQMQRNDLVNNFKITKELLGDTSEKANQASADAASAKQTANLSGNNIAKIVEILAEYEVPIGLDNKGNVIKIED